MIFNIYTCLLFLPLMNPMLFIESGNKNDTDATSEIIAIVEKIDATNLKTETLQADFVQKKVLNLLSEPMSLKGKFFLKKGIGMKFIFAPPENLEIYYTPRKIVSLSHNDKTASFKKIPKRKSDLTQVLLSEKINKILDYFSVSQIPGEVESDIALLLIPEKRKMKKRFKEIRLYLSKDYMVKKISMVETNDDYYEVVMTNAIVNAHLEDGIFEPEIPQDYQSGTSLDPIFGTQIGL